MGQFEYGPSDKEWAKRRGILRTCSKHNVDYDPWVGCPKCNQEKASQQQDEVRSGSPESSNRGQSGTIVICPFCYSTQSDYDEQSVSWKCRNPECQKEFTRYCLCTDCLHGKKEYCSEIWSPIAVRCQDFIHRESRDFRPKGKRPGLEARNYMHTTAELASRAEIDPYHEARSERASNGIAPQNYCQKHKTYCKSGEECPWCLRETQTEGQTAPERKVENRRNLLPGLIIVALVVSVVLAIVLITADGSQFGSPSVFSATAGNLQTTLTWSKGSQSGQVLIRFTSTDYPSGPTDGNLAYQGSGTSFIHGNLDSGKTYYYAIWSVRTSNGLPQYSKSASFACATPMP